MRVLKLIAFLLLLSCASRTPEDGPMFKDRSLGAWLSDAESSSPNTRVKAVWVLGEFLQKRGNDPAP